MKFDRNDILKFGRNDILKFGRNDILKFGRNDKWLLYIEKKALEVLSFWMVNIN